MQKENAINIAATLVLAAAGVWLAKKNFPKSTFYMVAFAAFGAFVGFNAGRLVNDKLKF